MTKNPLLPFPKKIFFFFIFSIPACFFSSTLPTHEVLKKTPRGGFERGRVMKKTEPSRKMDLARGLDEGWEGWGMGRNKLSS